MRKLAAIMFTDIVGFTALMGEDESKALQLLQKNRELLKPIIRQFHGEWLKEMGDGTLSSFNSAVDAVNCALVIQHVLKDDPDLKLRIGIHVGDLVFEGGDVFGDGVNVASRIEPLAEPGCVCVSERVYEDIKNKPGIEATSLGEKKLKGVDHPVKVFAVTEVRAPLGGQARPALQLRDRRWWKWAGAAAVVAVFVLMIWKDGFGKKSAPVWEPALGPKSIAVLPFANLSDSKEDEYFSDGVTDDIITHLTKIGDLKVISRTSVMRYKDSPKSLQVIARELGVSSVLEGSVRRHGNRVRITGQLIDAQTDQHLWAEAYDRDLTDIFAIQSDVAKNIAAALSAVFSPDDQSAVQQKPTENMEAYDYFLKGNYYWATKNTKEGNLRAAEMYERAIELDPDFALAFARLAVVHTALYSNDWDPTKERMQQARTAVDKAVSLAPENPEVHYAQGRYFERCLEDNDRALEEYKIAHQGLPNNGEIAMELGKTYGRLGQWEKAEQYLLKSFELDPTFTAFYVGYHYFRQHDWAEAERYLNLGINYDPEQARNYGGKAYLYISAYGDIEKARQALDEGLRNVNPDHLAGSRYYTEIMARNYREALTIAQSYTFIPLRKLRTGLTYYFLEEEQSAQAEFDSARILYEGLVEDVPQSAYYHGMLGLSYARLGMKPEAIREGKKAVEIEPLSKNAVAGTDNILSLSLIYTMVGEYDLAIEQLELLLAVPSWYSVWDIKLDPTFDPLREHPRYKALMEKYGE